MDSSREIFEVPKGFGMYNFYLYLLSLISVNNELAYHFIEKNKWWYDHLPPRCKAQIKYIWEDNRNGKERKIEKYGA